MTWPPPAEADAVWIEVRLDPARVVQVRQVRLWGQDVWIDADGLVLCDGCLELHTPEELLRDRSHPVSPSFAAQPTHFGFGSGPTPPSRAAS